MSESLLDLLEARRGLVFAVGAGGKKSVLYHLAGLHAGRVGITCTVFTLRFPRTLRAEMILTDEPLPPRVVQAAQSHDRIAYAHLSEKKGRLSGVPAEEIQVIHEEAGFDVTYIKGDGARMRGIKAPGDDEPQVLEMGERTVLPVVSARVIGEPLTEAVAHRPERISAVTGAAPEEVLTPAHIARLLASDQGALHRTLGARVVPVINMVDDAERERLAVRAAEEALERTDRFDRVVLTCLRDRDNPLVRVVERR